MRVNRAYKEFFTNTSRYFVLYGGAGSSKSYTTAQKILTRVMSEEHHRFLIVRKVARTLRPSVFQLFKDIITSEGYYNFFSINKTDMTMEFKNGSQILFFGLDDVEKLKSIQGITGIWIEEASEVSQEDLEQLDLRLRGETPGYKQIILTFNPISASHWLKKYFFDRINANTTTLKTTYLDNKFIDDEYKLTLERLKETNPTFYDVYCLGNWGVYKGLIYDNYSIVESLPEIYHSEVLGLDFGYNHNQSYVHVRIIEDNIFIDEVFSDSGYENEKFIEWVEQNRTELKDVLTFCDSARPDLIMQLKKRGFRVTEAKKDVFAGINFVKSKKLFITSRSVNLINELQTYSWREDKNGNSLDEPIKQNDDCMDAMRYAIYSHLSKTTRTKSLEVDFL